MLSVNGYQIHRNFFPDASLNLTCVGDLHGFFDLTDSYRIVWEFETVIEQVMLQNIVRHLQDKYRAKHINLVMPYVPNARMDRTKNYLEEVHTLKYFAEFINSFHFDSVKVLDPHSDVLMTLIDRCVIMPVKDFIEKAVDDFKPDYLFLPDKGALNRYDNEIIRTPFYGEKERDWKTGKIKSLIIHNPHNIPSDEYHGKKILIIDDICSKGGTFIHSARALKEMGFGDIALYVTHCEDSIFRGAIFNKDSDICHVYTTNSIFKDNDTNGNITVYPYAKTYQIGI